MRGSSTLLSKRAGRGVLGLQSRSEDLVRGDPRDGEAARQVDGKARLQNKAAAAKGLRGAAASDPGGPVGVVVGSRNNFVKDFVSSGY